MNTDAITNLTGNMTNGIALITIIPFILMGFGLFLWGWRGTRNASKSQSWPATTGRILSSEVEQRYSSESGTSFYPQIVFEYDVQGQRYKSNQINFGAQASYGMTSVAQNKILQYPVGRLVPVSYNPENPTQAVLEKTVSGASKILMIAGLFTVFFTLCIGVTVVGFSGMFSNLMQSVTTMAFK
jgi:hypothetical protein